MPRPFLPSFGVPGPIERGAGLFAAFLAAVEAMGERRGGGWAKPTRPLPGCARQRARSGAKAPLRRRPGAPAHRKAARRKPPHCRRTNAAKGGGWLSWARQA